MRIKILLSILSVLLCTLAFAQVQFPTPNTSEAVGSVPMCDNGSGKYIPCDPTHTVPTATSPSTPYPTGATPVSITNTGTTAATAATLPGTSGKTTYLCGFSISAAATTGTVGTATVTGPVGGTMSFVQPVGLLSQGGQLNLSFKPCIPANANNVGFVITSAAAGLGGTTAVNAWGFQL